MHNMITVRNKHRDIQIERLKARRIGKNRDADEFPPAFFAERKDK